MLVDICFALIIERILFINLLFLLFDRDLQNLIGLFRDLWESSSFLYSFHTFNFVMADDEAPPQLVDLGAEGPGDDEQEIKVKVPITIVTGLAALLVSLRSKSKWMTLLIWLQGISAQGRLRCWITSWLPSMARKLL
jgi:hypothetical protein